MQTIRNLLIAVLFALTASAASIQFTQEGWESGGRLSVEFAGMDLDKDGTFSQLELNHFGATFESPSGLRTSWDLASIQPDSFSFTDLGNYLYFVANSDYSLISTAFEGESLASIFDSNLFPVDSSSVSATEAPEPGGLVMLGLAALVCALAARRRLRAAVTGRGNVR